MSEKLPPPPSGFMETDDGRIVKCSEEQMSATEKNEKIVNTYKHLFMKRYNIVGVDIEKEFNLIQKKESRLSRSQREAVVTATQIFPVMEKKLKEQNEIEDLPVGSPATADDLKNAITQETQRRLAEKFIQNSQKTE